MKCKEWLSQHYGIGAAKEWINDYEAKCERLAGYIPEIEIKWEGTLWNVYRVWHE